MPHAVPWATAQRQLHAAAAAASAGSQQVPPLRVVTVYRTSQGRLYSMRASRASPNQYFRRLPLVGRYSFDRSAPTLRQLEALVHRVTGVPIPELAFYAKDNGGADKAVRREGRSDRPTSGERALCDPIPVLVEDDEIDEDEDESLPAEEDKNFVDASAATADATQKRQGRKRGRRAAPYARTITEGFHAAPRGWWQRGLQESVVFVCFAGDAMSGSTGCEPHDDDDGESGGNDSSTQKQNAFTYVPFRARFDLPVFVRGILRSSASCSSSQSTTDLGTFVFSILSGRVDDFKHAVARFTGVDPSRQTLEYFHNPLEESTFEDVLDRREKPKDGDKDGRSDQSPGQGSGIGGVLLREVILRDPEMQRTKADPNLRACCEETPYVLFVRFCNPTPHPAAQQWNANYSPYDMHSSTNPAGTNDRNEYASSATSLAQQAPANVSRRVASQCMSSEDMQTQRNEHHSRAFKRKKQQKHQVDVIDLDVDTDDEEEISKKTQKRHCSQRQEDPSAKKDVANCGRELPDPKHCRIKIKNIRIASSRINEKDRRVDDAISAIAPPNDGDDAARNDESRQDQSGDNYSRSSSAVRPMETPSSVEIHDGKRRHPGSNAAPDLHPSPTSSSSSSRRPYVRSPPAGNPSPPSSFCHPPRPTSPTDVELWLRALDRGESYPCVADVSAAGRRAEQTMLGNKRGGRILRHILAFVREFPCLEDVATACDAEGPDRVLDVCGVTAMGERACLRRAMQRLPRG